MSKKQTSFTGADPGEGGWIGRLATPSLGSFKLEIMKGSRAINEAILSLIVPISFCQVSYPPFKNAGSATGFSSIITKADKAKVRLT